MQVDLISADRSRITGARLRDRLILELRYGEQLSYAEISQALDMTLLR
jgi:DNA-directed RNA polymerase specialized sigma24 family protein